MAALAIAERLQTAPEGRTPRLTYLTIDDAAVLASSVENRLRVVIVGEGLEVTAQYPPAGDALPADGFITVWRGQPPAPPAPVKAVDTTSAEDLGGRVGSRSEGDVGSTAAPEDEVTPSPTPATAETPHPPRTNPGRLPPAEVGLVLSGQASWYGEEFAGRTTACGGVFDPAALTLASRELRCGTTVRITGPSGASVEAVVTDWGPAEWTSRRFDLSAATFAAIHHPGAGVINVTVEVLAQ